MTQIPFDDQEPKVDWRECPHKDTYSIYDEVDGAITKCDDCGAWLDEDHIVIRPPQDEIPF